MGKLVLYGMEASPAVRAVLLTLNALNLDYEFREVNLAKGENRTDDFLKKNPQGTIPVLEDDGKSLWDSHAIGPYLVRKYGKNDALYPKDFLQRAIVDQRLHFDSGVLYICLKNIIAAVFTNVDGVPQDQIDLLYGAYDYLESFLENDYLGGDTLTIADFSAVAAVTSLDVVAPVNSAKTPKLQAWIHRLTKLPYYEKANGKGAAEISGMLKTKLASK